MKLVNFPWTPYFELLMKELIDWIRRHAVWHMPWGEGRREKSDSLLFTHTRTHKHMCTHISIEMNEAIHRKQKLCWFVRLGTKSQHLNLPELSCTYQKNVSPAVPVSLFCINVSPMISTVHGPNPEGLTQP